MAEFTEEKASDLQKRFNLSKAIINKWRYRGSIPNKYFKTSTATEDKAHSVLVKRILSILEAGFINRAVLCKLTNTLTKQTYSGDIKPEQALAIKKELQQIKIDISKTFNIKSESKLKKLIADERLFLKVILKNDLHYNRLMKFKNNNAYLEAETYQFTKDKYMIAVLQIKI